MQTITDKIERLQGVQPDPRVAALVSSAADATEHFTDDELEAHASKRRPEIGFVSADGQTIIDTIHPATGRSACYGKTLEDVQQEYPGAFIQSVADYCAAKAAKQDAPGEWIETTEDIYDEMLGALPPASWVNYAEGRSGFLVGEAWDHHAGTGRPRFSCFKQEDGKFHTYSRPMTFREFKGEFGETARYGYSE